MPPVPNKAVGIYSRGLLLLLSLNFIRLNLNLVQGSTMLIFGKEGHLKWGTRHSFPPVHVPDFLVHSGCQNKIPQNRWLIKNKNIFLTLLEAEKTQLRHQRSSPTIGGKSRRKSSNCRRRGRLGHLIC